LEEVARARLLLAVVLLELQECKGVRVPRLEVDSEGTLALAAALVDEARRRVEDAPGWPKVVEWAISEAARSSVRGGGWAPRRVASLTLGVEAAQSRRAAP
jgi:hypothetical protein